MHDVIAIVTSRYSTAAMHERLLVASFFPTRREYFRQTKNQGLFALPFYDTTALSNILDDCDSATRRLH